MRDRLSVLRNVLRMLKLLWKVHPAYFLIVIGIRLIRSLIPIIVLWIGKLIIDLLAAAANGRVIGTLIWKLLAVEIVIVVIADLLGRLSVMFETLLGELLNQHLSVEMMKHTSSLDLHHFEDPAFYDRLERARTQSGNKIELLTQVTMMVQELSTIISLGVALCFFSPWLFLLLFITLLPGFLGESYFSAAIYSLQYRWTPQRRMMEYLRYVGAHGKTVKEIQLFGLSAWLISRFNKLFQSLYHEKKRLHLSRVMLLGGLTMIGTLGYYLVYAVILHYAIKGRITIGTVTFLIGSFQRARDTLQRQLSGMGAIYRNALFLKDLFEFFSLTPTIGSRPGAPAVPRPIREGIVFADVSFRYPGSDKWALRHVNLAINVGEVIALIGENGAGKTTISKLLTRLYDPTEGSILLDGKDLRDYELTSLRREIGVLFQDYVCYDWRFDENIGVGQIEGVRAYLDSSDGATPAAIRSAAERSQAARLLPRFPAGYRQMLGRRFAQGVELSGGEWQKVALARAYIRDAQLLILDEPTAALDARAEYEVFKSLSHLVDRRMTILISHRFSTVRMADRIIVLRQGRVIEEGDHTDLVAKKDGLYAELFTLQAEGYR